MDRPGVVVSRVMRGLLCVGTLWFVSALHAQSLVGSAEAGRAKASQCVGCHQIPGYRASYPRVYSVPLIAGQHSAYLQDALRAYRKGDRSHPTMRAVAASLSDQDIADLAALYGAH
jgi:cytochrome c553